MSKAYILFERSYLFGDSVEKVVAVATTVAGAKQAHEQASDVPALAETMDEREGAECLGKSHCYIDQAPLFGEPPPPAPGGMVLASEVAQCVDSVKDALEKAKQASNAFDEKRRQNQITNREYAGAVRAWKALHELLDSPPGSQSMKS